MTEPEPKLVLRKKAVCRLLSISTATLDRLRARKDFPPPVRISDQLIGWTRATVEDWLEQRAQGVH